MKNQWYKSENSIIQPSWVNSVNVSGYYSMIINNSSAAINYIFSTLVKFIVSGVVFVILLLGIGLPYFD